MARGDRREGIVAGGRLRAPQYAALPPIRGDTLRDRVLAALRKAIVNGSLPPGRRLREEELSHHLGVSRGPLREAISRLTEEGLVSTVPNRGSFVAKLSAEDAREVYLVRAALEGLAAQLVAERAAQSDVATALDRLDDLADRMVKTARRRDLEGMAALDSELHLRLVGLSGVRRLETVWLRLRDQIRPIARRSLDHPAADPVAIAKHHVRVLGAVRAGHAHEARRLVEEHIVDASRRAVEQFRIVTNEGNTTDRVRAARTPR